MQKLSNLVGYSALRTTTSTKLIFARKASPNDGGRTTTKPSTRRKIYLHSHTPSAGRRKIEIHQMDVNTAFLYRDPDKVVYIEQSEGFGIPEKEDWVLLLNKALYDLKQSPRACFLKIAPTFVEFDFEQ